MRLILMTPLSFPSRTDQSEMFGHLGWSTDVMVKVGIVEVAHQPIQWADRQTPKVRSSRRAAGGYCYLTLVPVGCRSLLIEALFDDFFACLGTECAPQTVGTLGSWGGIAGAIDPHRTVGRIASFHGVGHEDNGTVSHQYVHATLMSTAGRHVTEAPSIPTHADFGVGWQNRVHHGVRKVSVRPAKAPTLIVGQQRCGSGPISRAIGIEFRAATQGVAQHSGRTREKAIGMCLGGAIAQIGCDLATHDGVRQTVQDVSELDFHTTNENTSARCANRLTDKRSR